MQKKDKIELSITSGLVLLLLFFIISGVKNVKKARHRLKRNKITLDIQQIKQQPIIEEKQNVSGKELFQKLEEETSKLELKRDPFAVVQITPVMVCPHGLCLKGIVWDEKMPTAIINNNIVGKGDKIGDSVIISIELNRVILNDGVADFELNLNIELK